MATLSWSCRPSCADATRFREWGASIGNALTTLGWVKTADTGQIDWSTVAAPTAVNTIMGWEIFRMDDALQKATMYALGCKSMKEVKAKFAKKCACGSGKKFKNCCLQKVLDEANAEEPQQDEPKARGPYQLLTSVDDLAFFGGPPGMRGSHPPYQEEVEQ